MFTLSYASADVLYVFSVHFATYVRAQQQLRLVSCLREQEQSSGLFTLGVVSYCLGVALVCERLNLSHEVDRVSFSLSRCAGCRSSPL